MRAGIIQKICAKFKLSPLLAQRELLLTLSHFFHIQPLPSNVGEADYASATGNVVLASLPANVRAVVDEEQSRW
jgi:hypothetical protein